MSVVVGTNMERGGACVIDLNSLFLKHIPSSSMRHEEGLQLVQPFVLSCLLFAQTSK